MILVRLICLAQFAAVLTFAATPELDIRLATGADDEAKTREQLLRVTAKYDVSKWIGTRTIIIEKGAIPHSHPVLTLNARHRNDDLLLLSSFVHEQLHWYEEAHRDQRDAAIAELKKQYPGVPVGGDDGADNETSSYLHVIVCYFEYQAMKELAGGEQARRVMEFWSTDHYRAIYRMVLDKEAAIGEVLRRNGLSGPAK